MGKSKDSKREKKKEKKDPKREKKSGKRRRLEIDKNWKGPKRQIDPEQNRFKLKLRKSTIHRWGVYATVKIPAGRNVIEYTGERISRKETKRRSDLYEKTNLNYLFTLDKYWTIDGAVGGSGAEFINHSCDPNCCSKIIDGHIMYLSLRKIKPSEELTVDYRFEADAEEVACHCGAAKCRGKINLK